MSKRRKKKSDNKNSWRIVIMLIVLLAGVWFADNIRARDEEKSMAVEVPEGLLDVITNPKLKEERLNRLGMDISFNSDMHEPNWVAWELTREETYGKEKRSGFSADPDVEGSADPRDYTNSGYDRGHMAPAGDMKWDAEAMRECCLMTNICPQAKALNTGAWRNLEESCRRWAQRDSAIFIVCGPILTDPITEYIGKNKVAVPSRFFKVVLAPYAKPARAIGFIFPNSAIKGGMQAAVVSVDSVERATGHDFFSQLPDSIEDIVEAQADLHLWNSVK